MYFKPLVFIAAFLSFTAPVFAEQQGLSKKDCAELSKDTLGLMAAADHFFRETEKHQNVESKEYKEAWEGAIIFSELSANWSTVYDVWCKDA
tara:strand:- start:1500 stop:1775 length:276 start_codon:yes stop_codon:yes gene_type:complete